MKGIRWVKFNLVGIAGVLVQLAVLDAFLAQAHLAYPAATLAAVEVTLLHNFAWHCVFTWRDRPAAGACTLICRFMRFQLSNGTVSLGGNLLLMHVFAGLLKMPPVAANGVAIVACSMVNYVLGDRFVFREISDHC